MLSLVVMVACSPTNGETVSGDTEVADGEAAVNAVEQRLEDLERRLEELAAQTPSDTSGLAQLDERLLGLEQLLGDFDTRIINSADAHETLAERVDETTTDFRMTLADLRDTITEARALIDDLYVRYEILQRRIDQLSQ